MARYEHLQIYRDAYDLTVHVEKIVRNFSRYHKYTLGTDLRNRMRGVLETVIEANNTLERSELLMEIRRQLENLKVLCRLCHDSGEDSPAINTTYFLNTIGEYYWTSTTWMAGTTSAWGVNFTHGKVAANNKGNNFPVRPVRLGP